MILRQPVKRDHVKEMYNILTDNIFFAIKFKLFDDEDDLEEFVGMLQDAQRLLIDNRFS